MNIMGTKNKDRNEQIKVPGKNSGNETGNQGNLQKSAPDETLNNYFKNMDDLRDNDKMMVDNAWNNLFARIKDDNLLTEAKVEKVRFVIPAFVRIAAMLIIAVGITFTGKFLVTHNTFASEIAVSTTAHEKNKLVELADGSTVYLNSNSTLSYYSSFGQRNRKVELKGEAFFNITPDAKNPFTIDAGEANVEVVGTSFNVMTNNGNNEVEVLVKTGKVILASSNGAREITLEPGDIGTMNDLTSSQSVNEDLNYLSWNTNVLVYDGATLDKTFADLKRVHDINIVALDKSILNKRISTSFDHQSPDTIVTMICRTFNLNFEKADGIYYISGK